VLYQLQETSAINEAEKRIEIFMKKWHALFHYVEVEQKEVFYQLEKDGILLKKDYFDPKVLSFTYIARKIQEKYEEQEKANGKIPYGYRIAATTPRNPVNLATKHEAEILNRFRNNEIDKFTEFLYKDNEKFYVSYTPIERTTKSCMRCHSTPDKAPEGLVERYGKKAGFGVSIGVIRGMVIMEIPFSEIEKEAFDNFALTSLIIFFVFVGFFTINTNLSREKSKSDKLLLNILPAGVASDLREKGKTKPESFEDVTVYFSDVVGFTDTSSKLEPNFLISELNDIFTTFDNIVEKYECERIKTIGDAYLCVCGMPEANKNHAINIVQSAIEIIDFLTERNRHSEITWEIRIGIHTGKVVGGVVGVKKYIYDVFGDTINTAARMESNSEPMKINISECTYNLIHDKFHIIPRGVFYVKGKGDMKMYFVEK